MKLPKLTKAEREAIIEDLLDWALDYADPEDMRAEIRSIFKKGLPYGLTPYLYLSDEDLLQKLARQTEPVEKKDWSYTLTGYFKPPKAARILKATKEYYE
jgi:hypothetical protein